MKKLIFLVIGLSALIIFVSCSSNQDGDKKRDPFPGTDFNKISEVLNNSTYLMKQSVNFERATEKNCTKSKRDIFGEKYDDNSSIEMLDAKEMQQELVRIVGNTQTAQNLTQQIKTFFDANKNTDDVGDFGDVCKKDDNIYVLFDPKYPGVTISLWKDGKTLEFFKENNEVAYFGGGTTMSIFLEVFGDKSLIEMMSTDISAYYWTFDLIDPKTMKAETVEQCQLEFDYDDKTFFVNADKFELTCDKEYKP